MMKPVPAPGFYKLDGKRYPKRRDQKFWVQLRNGWVDELGPWPAVGPRWTWTGGPFDIVAVRKA